MADEIDILSAIKEGELFSGMDPLHYAAITRTELEGINPLLWAIENGKTINGENPVLFALKNEGFDTNHDILETANSTGHIIAIGSNNYFMLYSPLQLSYKSTYSAFTQSSLN